MSFSSLYVGATGVIAHGDRMQVVGNNLANVSTIGYKKSDALFGDLMSQTMATGGSQSESGAMSFSQIGKGVAVSQIRNIMTEGGLENTSQFTDLAITGNGFFGVRKATGLATATGASHYTRAGAFLFNNEAYLVDPHDYRVQGYAVDRITGEVSTTISDVQLPYEDIVIDGVETRVIRSEPLPTSQVEMVTNLDAVATDGITSETDPFFALLAAYNADETENEVPFTGDNLPSYSSGLVVYDEDGNERELTVYFDPVSTENLSNASAGYSYWEYVIVMPAEADGSAAYGTSSAGLAGMGVLTFNGNGELVNNAAYTLDTPGGTKDLSAWTATTFSDDGIPQYNFQFGSNGDAIGTTQTMSLDFGVSSSTGTWLSGAATAAGVGTNTANLQGMSDMDRDARVSTSFNTGSSTVYQIQNGYSWGYMDYAEVDREGMLSGHFTNGKTEQFYQIAVYRFTSEYGLRRDGNNNFVATQASGEALAGVAQENGRGTVMQNTLEQSNVDMAEEFAKMILTQRGYQANTKVITTGDSLLNTTISIKR